MSRKGFSRHIAEYSRDAADIFLPVTISDFHHNIITDKTLQDTDMIAICMENLHTKQKCYQSNSFLCVLHYALYSKYECRDVKRVCDHNCTKVLYYCQYSYIIYIYKTFHCIHIKKSAT